MASAARVACRARPPAAMAAELLGEYVSSFVDEAVDKGWDVKHDEVSRLIAKLGALGLRRVRDLRRGLPENDEVR